MEIDGSGLQMSGSKWDWGSEWMEVDGSMRKWMGVVGSG